MKVQNYKRNLMASYFTIAGRNILVLNIYVKPEWKVDDLRDYIDVVCWTVEAAKNFDPCIGIIVGGDLNLKGMREL